MKTKLRLTTLPALACAITMLVGNSPDLPGQESNNENPPAPSQPVVRLKEMVITGTRTERLVQEAPVKTELILGSDLASYNVTSFRDALKLIPTARFENECQNCALNQIQLMGLGTDYTAILFDGAPLYSGLAKVYGADLFPAVFIDRIEVVKGGSSVLYGPEAMAGVINLITAEPLHSGFEASAGLECLKGEALEWETSLQADYVAPDGHFSLSTYGFAMDREALDLSTDGFSEIAEFSNVVLGSQAWWRPFKGTTLKANYQFMDQAHRGGDRLDLPEEQARVAESLAHNIHLAQFSWKQRLNSGFDFTLAASYLFIERESFYGARADNEQRAWEEAGNTGEVIEDFINTNQNAIDAVARRVWGLTENHVYFIDSQFNHYIGRHTLSYGLQYRFEDLTDGSLYDSANTPTTEDDFSNVGLFIQDQWEISDKLELVPGIRIDDHDNVEDSILSPRLAARYFLGSEWTLRASWSTGFNAPGAFNEDKHIGVNNGGAIFLANEPGLSEERSQTFSIGGEFMPAAFENSLILHTQIHYTKLEDSFEIDDSGEISGDPNLWLRFNGSDATVWVWETNLNWQINPHLRLDTGLSYVRARLDQPVERVTGLTTNEFIERPEWTGHIGVSYENHDLINLHALLTYTGSMLAVGEDADIWRQTDPFYVLDIGLSKDFDGFLGADHFTLSAGVENLFDQRQKDLQNSGEERDPTYLYGPAQPVTYYLRLTAVW